MAKSKAGRKYNIPVFVPHRGCPFDCVFCDQKRITGRTVPVTPDDVTETIERYLATIPENAETEAAFFGGSFTGIPTDEQNALMERVRPYIAAGRIDGIRISTRPDYIDDTILDNLVRHNVTTVELGVQSMCDEVLKCANRGHTSKQVTAAAKLIKERGISLGLQMMTGLPGDTDEQSVYTAEKLIELRPDCVRIYPTLTIAGTYLEKMWRDGRYTPQTLDGAVKLAKKLILMFEAAGIDVIRVGLQPTEEINEDAAVVAGPFHSAFGELAEGEIYYDLIKEKLPPGVRRATVEVAPGEVSKAVGNRRRNTERLRAEGYDIKVRGTAGLKNREVRVIAS